MVTISTRTGYLSKQSEYDGTQVAMATHSWSSGQLPPYERKPLYVSCSPKPFAAMWCGDTLTVCIQEPSGVRRPHLLNETMPKAGFQVHRAIVRHEA